MADDKFVQDDTDRPGINLKAVSIRSIKQYLRGNIVRCAANSLLPLARALDKRGETEVTSLDVQSCDPSARRVAASIRRR